MYAELDIQTTPIFEGSTPVYSFQIVDAAGVHVPLSALTTVVLTYYDRGTLAVLNSRQGQDVLNANNITITMDGLVTWDLQPADTTRATGVTGMATHEATFAITYDDNGTTRVSIHKAQFFIIDASLVAPAI